MPDHVWHDPRQLMSGYFSRSISFANQLIIIMCVLELVDTLTYLGLDRFGIRPMAAIGLIGIIFSPLLHAGWEHLLVNALPLWANTVLLFGEKKFRPVWTFGFIWIVSGVGTWLLGGLRGGEAIHIGASSLIFGLVAYLVLMGVFLGRFVTILISVVVVFFFGGILTGVLPNPDMPQVSWEAHLSGALAGIIAAIYNRFYRKKRITVFDV